MVSSSSIAKILYIIGRKTQLWPELKFYDFWGGFFYNQVVLPRNVFMCLSILSVCLRIYLLVYQSSYMLIFWGISSCLESHCRVLVKDVTEHFIDLNTRNMFISEMKSGTVSALWPPSCSCVWVLLLLLLAVCSKKTMETKQSRLQWTIACKFSFLFPSPLSLAEDCLETNRTWHEKTRQMFVTWKYQCAQR